VNAIRIAIDRRETQFYRVGQHPTVLQTVDISPSFFEQALPMDADVCEFILRKVYWLGFREGADTSRVPVADPYDGAHL
jgi:hypothetical protein